MRRLDSLRYIVAQRGPARFNRTGLPYSLRRSPEAKTIKKLFGEEPKRLEMGSLENRFGRFKARPKTHFVPGIATPPSLSTFDLVIGDESANKLVNVAFVQPNPI